MSLPPALLARLAQRGLVQKKARQREDSSNSNQEENEEVIAEDYDEMESEQNQQGPEDYPSIYDHQEKKTKRPLEENFWAERMRARMGESTSAAGYKGCPNKYNIWHKCNLYCVNRWGEGHQEPSREYMRRYKRLLRKFPLPKGWTEIYDPGCGCFYFYSATENLVSWLPPTHPKSQVTKSSAILRRQLEETSSGGGAGNGGSDGEQHSDEDDNENRPNAAARHQREVDDIISASMRPRSPPTSREYGAESMGPPRKQKSRDLDRVLLQRQHRREREREFERERERDRDRERDRERERDRGSSRRHYGREEPDILDPMDPSAYSDTPRGKWSSGLNTANEERASKSTSNSGDGSIDNARERRKERRNEPSDDENDYEH